MFMSEKVKVPRGAGATERPGLPGRPPRPAPATTAQASTLSPASDGGCPSRAHLAPSLWLRGTPGHRAAEKTEPDGTCARHHARSGGGRRRLGDQSDGGGTAAPRSPREGLASMRSRSVKRHGELVGRWAEDRAGRARSYGSVPVRGGLSTPLHAREFRNMPEANRKCFQGVTFSGRKWVQWGLGFFFFTLLVLRSFRMKVFSLRRYKKKK